MNRYFDDKESFDNNVLRLIQTFNNEAYNSGLVTKECQNVSKEVLKVYQGWEQEVPIMILNKRYCVTFGSTIGTIGMPKREIRVRGIFLFHCTKGLSKEEIKALRNTVSNVEFILSIFDIQKNVFLSGTPFDEMNSTDILNYIKHDKVIPSENLKYQFKIYHTNGVGVATVLGGNASAVTRFLKGCGWEVIGRKKPPKNFQMGALDTFNTTVYSVMGINNNTLAQFLVQRELFKEPFSL